VRYADVLVHGTRTEAEAHKAEISQLLASKLKMTLSDEKTTSPTSTTGSCSSPSSGSASS
jgi:hypothetical protein